MSVLLIRLCGAMQSWGTKSRFYDRDTENFPSKSGILGIVGAALGRDRAEDISDLTALNIGVRRLKSGGQKKEWQTVEDATDEKNYGFPYRKYYLSDADFVVGLEGERKLLEQIYAALRNPVYPLFLGRKSYVAAKPIVVLNGIVEVSLYKALRDFRYDKDLDFDEIKRMKRKYFDNDKQVRKDRDGEIVVYEQTMIFDASVTVDAEKSILETKIQDLPISFADRNYMLRDVAVYHVKYDIETELNYLLEFNKDGGENVSE